MPVCDTEYAHAPSHLGAATRRRHWSTRMKFRPVVSSRYDHLDRRVQKVTPEATHTYFYDAFGKLISNSGLMADLFAIRYSTKYFDSETGFYYYGYRFYSPELKRWLTRDPIGEDGGVNKGSSNFKKSAETYKRHIEKQSTFDPKCDSVEIYAIRTKTDFYARWNQFAIQSRKESNASNRYKVKALHLFTHSGLGQLYLHKEALSAQHLQKLKRLNWADGAELVCHGCSSGVENKFGNSVAGSFYKSQKISTLGQAAASSFSSEPNTKSKWGVVFGTSTDVYLWAFDSDGNAIEAIKYPKTDKETQ